MVQNKKKRILILTDSLGCPREETSVEKTWTDKILQKWTGSNMYFYTYCKHGLEARHIDFNYIKEIQPDLIIVQLGIVDACRRAFSRKFIFIVSHIPIISKLVNAFARRFHYFLTKIKNIHSTKPKDFRNRLMQLSNIAENVVFISIAPPGKSLKERVYKVKTDVIEYNNIIKDVATISKKKLLNPYQEIEKIDSILLNDGHHLNDIGISLVFNECDKFLTEYLNKMEY